MNPRDYLAKIKLPDPPPITPEQAAAHQEGRGSGRRQEGQPATGAPQRRPTADRLTPGGEGGGAGGGGGGGGGRGRGNPAEFFTNLDKNGDSKISKDELPAVMADRLTEANADTNGDGDLDRTEFMAAMAKMPP